MHDGASCRSARRPSCSSSRAHTFVGYFIGSPGMNVLPAAGRADARRGSTATSSGCAAITARCRPARRSSSACGRNSSTSRAPAHGLLPATIERIDDLGRITLRRASASAMRKFAARVPTGHSRAGRRGRAGLRSGARARLRRQPAGRGGCLMDKTDQSEGLVPGPAGVPAGGVLARSCR